LLHVHTLSVQRLPKVPVRVDRRGIWFGMAQHRLTDRDVFGRLVRPGAL
jgi:hypothetical protein